MLKLLEFVINLVVSNNFFRIITRDYEYSASYIVGYSPELIFNETNTLENEIDKQEDPISTLDEEIDSKNSSNISSENEQIQV